MAQPQPQPRKKTIIDSSLQYKLAFGSVALFAIATFAVWFDIRAYLFDLSARGVLGDIHILSLFEDYTKIVSLKIGIGLMLAWAVALYFSNRIAGPIYNLKRTLNAIKSGDLTQRIKFRKSDQFRYIADEFNSTADTIREKIQTDREEAAQVAKLLESIASKAGGNVGKELQALSSRVEKLTHAFKI